MKGQGSRGRNYGVLLILAFGVAILGVMAVHKLRERRILNLLVKEKDHQLISLHILLQKEKGYKEEAKKITEEMKAKTYSLQTQKADLDSRISEMQSTISSLKDEQRTIESALEEKQNEIKSLREREEEANKENPQVVALMETLKQKEAEIEDLKNRLETPTKVLSVSTDDPSNPAANLTQTESVTWGEKSEASGMKEESGEERSKGADESLHESTTYRDGDSSTRGEDRRDDGTGFSATNEMTGDHSQKSNDEVQGERFNDSQDGGGLGTENEKNSANETEMTVNHGANEATEGEGHGLGGTVEMEKLNSEGGESQQLETKARGGIKLEMPDISQDDAGDGARGKHGHRINSKGKRWRMIARNRRHGGSMGTVNEDAVEGERYKRLRDAELQKLGRRGGNQNVDLKMKGESGQGDEKVEVDSNLQQGESWEAKNVNPVRVEEGEEGKDSRKDIGNTVASGDTNSRNSEGAENESGNGGSTGINQETEKGHEADSAHENFEKPNRTPDDIQNNKTVDSESSGTAGDSGKQKSDELRQSEENASGVQQQTETRDGDKVDQNSEEAKVADKYEEPEELEAAETQEPETDLRESRAKLKENEEESGEDTDEPEF